MPDILLLDPHLLAAANFSQAAATGSALATNFAKEFWSNVFQMGIFGRVAQVSLTIAGIGVIYRGYYFFLEIKAKTLDAEKVVGFLMVLILVLLMLWNSGQLAMYTVLGMRNFTNSISDTVMQGISFDFSKLQATRSLNGTNLAQSYFVKFEDELKKCAPAAQTACFQQALNNLKQSVAANPEQDPVVNAKIAEIQIDLNNAAGIQPASNSATSGSNTTTPPSGTSDGTIDEKAKWDIIGKVGDSIKSMGSAISNAFESLIQLVFTCLAIAFYIALELTLLVFGFTFPINIALSLFDPAPIKNWFGNFWLLVNAKLCFAIIVGIIVYLNLWAQSQTGLASLGIFTIGILMAIYAPFLTFFYCQGSALALAGAMNSLTSAPARGAAKGAASTGGRAAGKLGSSLLRGVGMGMGKRGKAQGRKIARMGRKK
jgi:hypothetical protein